MFHTAQQPLREHHTSLVMTALLQQAAKYSCCGSAHACMGHRQPGGVGPASCLAAGQSRLCPQRPGTEAPGTLLGHGMSGYPLFTSSAVLLSWLCLHSGCSLEAVSLLGALKEPRHGGWAILSSASTATAAVSPPLAKPSSAASHLRLAPSLLASLAAQCTAARQLKASTFVLMHQITCRQEDKPGQQWQSAFRLSTTSVSSLASVLEEHRDR